MPAAHFRARAVLSNTSPTRPYRSAGRPEVMFVMERLIDLAARECGFDRVALRRRNLLTATEMPYTNPFGMDYDSGDYIDVMETGAQARRLGRLQAPPRRGEEARQVSRHRRRQLRRHRDRRAAREGRDHGAARRHRRRGDRRRLAGPGPRDELCAVDHRMAGRADRERCASSPATPIVVKVGGGAHSGRGMRLGSIVIKKSSDDIIEKGTRIAEHLLETAAGRHRIQERPLCREGHRPLGRHLRGRARRAGAHRPAGGSARPARRALRRDRRGRELSLRRACLRGRGRSRHRRGRDRQLRGGRRRRPRGQSADHPRPGPRRHRAGRRPGAAASMCTTIPRPGSCFRRRSWTTPCRARRTCSFYDTELSEVPSTTHPLGIRPAGEGGTAPALAVVINAICRCAVGLRRAPHRDAGDARARVAGDSPGEVNLSGIGREGATIQ